MMSAPLVFNLFAMFATRRVDDSATRANLEDGMGNTPYRYYKRLISFTAASTARLA